MIFSLTVFTQARAQGHSYRQQAVLQGSGRSLHPAASQMGPHQGPLPRLPLAPPLPTYGRKMQGYQKVTLKKSLFKKVLAARTVTKH